MVDDLAVGLVAWVVPELDDMRGVADLPTRSHTHAESGAWFGRMTMLSRAHPCARP